MSNDYEPSHAVSEPERKTFPLFTNETYDKLKWFTQIFLPAVGTLYFALAALWGLPEPEKVVGTIVAIDTFLGVILLLANKAYLNSDARFDGTMHVRTEQTDEGPAKTVALALETDPFDLDQQDTVTFKVSPNPLQ